MCFGSLNLFGVNLHCVAPSEAVGSIRAGKDVSWVAPTGFFRKAKPCQRNVHHRELHHVLPHRAFTRPSKQQLLRRWFNNFPRMPVERFNGWSLKADTWVNSTCSREQPKLCWPLRSWLCRCNPMMQRCFIYKRSFLRFRPSWSSWWKGSTRRKRFLWTMWWRSPPISWTLRTNQLHLKIAHRISSGIFCFFFTSVIFFPDSFGVILCDTGRRPITLPKSSQLKVFFFSLPVDRFHFLEHVLSSLNDLAGPTLWIASTTPWIFQLIPSQGLNLSWCLGGLFFPHLSDLNFGWGPNKMISFSRRCNLRVAPSLTPFFVDVHCHFKAAATRCRLVFFPFLLGRGFLTYTTVMLFPSSHGRWWRSGHGLPQRRSC